MTNIEQLAKNAKTASYKISVLDTLHKNKALFAIADILEDHKDEIFKTNLIDINKAKADGLSEALVDRLTLNESRFKEMVEGVRKVATLEDPVGRIYEGRTLENGLSLYKKSVPFGVVGVIYESRPNVTVDIAALCLKSGNACFLKGGKEAINTNVLLHSLICTALETQGLDKNIVTFLNSTSREDVATMLTLDEYIDVLIPRGGVNLQRMCQRQSSIPVIIGGFGISHIFVDASANLEKSVKIVLNAKTQKPSACNSLDTLLVHKDIAQSFIQKLTKALNGSKVSIVAFDKAYDLCKAFGYELLSKGQSGDFDTEYLSLKFNLAIVNDVTDAITHLRVHNASHSDAILTDSLENAKLFTNNAGSACVYVNASTRFSDGGQFGLGAEVAISTQKLHARGPMALKELNTYQYVCSGDYLVRA